MSTDRKRLNSAIQRIAREDPEIRKLLEDFRNSGGKPSESATSGSGAEDRQICCDGGTSGSTNPGSDTRDTGDGGKDGTDLGDDPANLDDMGGGSLAGVTDCATGQPICFEGSDWIPPDGWDGPTDPPIDPTYTEGEYYFVTLSTSAPKFWSPTKGGIFSYVEGETGWDECYQSVGDKINCTMDEGGLLTTSYRIGSATCPDGSTESYCNPADDEISLKEWPSDECVNLAVKGGKLVGSKYDPENDGSWSAPRNEVELCDAFGNKFKLKASGSIEGGWKSISPQNPDDGYLYNAQGQQIARISESEYSDPTM